MHLLEKVTMFNFLPQATNQALRRPLRLHSSSRWVELWSQFHVQYFGKPKWKHFYVLQILCTKGQSSVQSVFTAHWFLACIFLCSSVLLFYLFTLSLSQHTSLSASRTEKGTGWSSRSLGARCRNSIALCSDEQPHIGNYRLLKTIGKGNFAKVKLARHILTGREVSSP